MKQNCKNDFVLAIVGGGPNCVYALDRIAALYYGKPTTPGIDIHIFDRGGLFGCGAVHDIGQSTTSLLNRMAGQIAFGANEDCMTANYLLPRDKRFDFMEWLERKFEETDSNEYLMEADDWPPRYLHGLALQDAFNNYLEIIRGNSSCEVFVYSTEVVDICRDGSRHSVIFGENGERLEDVDEILFATGNQRHQVQYLVEKTNLETLDKKHLQNISPLYPVEENLSYEKVAPQSTLGIKGSGVSALDALLYLTEGRRGRFVQNPETNELMYVPSGDEPKKIFIIGRSGLFASARPRNEKSAKWSSNPTEGYYFNTENIERLRQVHGIGGVVTGVGKRKQLDFEKHVLPLVVLEMSGNYYSCLMGGAKESELFECAREMFGSFIRGDLDSSNLSRVGEQLTHPLHEMFGAFFHEIMDRGADALAEYPVLAAYIAAALSELGLERTASVKYLSNRGDCSNSLDVIFRPDFLRACRKNLESIFSSICFNWEKIENPLSDYDFADGNSYKNKTLQIIDRDLWEARRGNLSSPLKYACDTVWRDYRPVFTDCVDFGGLTPASHKMFLSRYVAIHNRIADGPSLTVIEKLRTMIAEDVIEIRLGPRPDIYFDPNTSQFRSVSRIDQREETFDRLVLCFLEMFNPEGDESPLFRNMLNSGIISKWESRSEDGSQVFECGIALNGSLNPISSDGRIRKRLTFIGPPIEGIRFFHHTLSRPDTVQPTIRNLVGWGNRLEKAIDDAFASMSSDASTSSELVKDRAFN